MTVSVGDGVSVPLVQPFIYRGDTQPTGTPAIGDLWEDTSSNPPVLRHCTDLSPITWDPVSTGSGSSTKTVGITVDGGGSTITTGTKGYITVPFSGTIDQWFIVADQSGSIVMDVWKATSPTIPTNANSITGSEKPTLSSAQFNSDTALSTWTTSVTAGDILGFEVESVTTVQRVTLTIRIS